MPGLARKSGWNAASTEPFDFSLHCSNCAVCRYSVATKGTFIQKGCSASATLAGARCWRRPAPRRRWSTSAAGAGTRARSRGELALAGVVLTSQRRQPAPAAGVGLALAHIQVPPAVRSFTAELHAHCPRQRR